MNWPFGVMSQANASREAILIAEFDLSRYGMEEEVVIEFKRYLLLRFLWKRRITMQSEIVDSLWHCFILDTKRYREFCDSLFGEYLDHESSHFALDNDFPEGYKLMFGQELPRVWFEALRNSGLRPNENINCA